MLFSSIEFIYLFLPTVLILNYGVFRKSRFLKNVTLLAASLFFYAWGEPKCVLLMIGSIIVNWFIGIGVGRFRDDKRKSRMLVALDILINLAVLFVFKYLVFSVGVINDIFGTGLPVPNIALPIGISFFTFQAISYVIDIYREKGEVQKNILNVGLYISFFPQLIAGPIIRYNTVAEEIRSRNETPDDLFDGLARFIVGLSKKVLLANSFALIADSAFDAVKNGEGISAMFGWLGAVSYTFQIFFDFSGYSDMAIGLGRMFGFHFSENFNYPYISASVTEFWRRWHISLGQWFRDYVYIPMGGSRCGKARTVLNLFAVWLLTGIWHGANYTFIVWGLMYFVLLTIEKLTGINKKGGRVFKVLGWIYTFFFVVIGWVIFRAESLGDAFRYIQSLFGAGGSFSDDSFIGWFQQNAILLSAGAVLSTPVFKALSEKTKKSNVVAAIKAVVLFCLFVLSIASLVSSTHNPFIYFNF